VAQDAFAKAYRSFRQLRDRDRFRGWLVRMTWRIALDHRRGDRRRSMREEQLVAPVAAPDRLEDDAIATERSAQLWHAIDALPEKLRLPIVLVSIEEDPESGRHANRSEVAVCSGGVQRAKISAASSVRPGSTCDRTGRMPMYIILVDEWFYEVNKGRLWMNVLHGTVVVR
jgi:hypothetical protein